MITLVGTVVVVVLSRPGLRARPRPLRVLVDIVSFSIALISVFVQTCETCDKDIVIHVYESYTQSTASVRFGATFSAAHENEQLHSTRLNHPNVRVLQAKGCTLLPENTTIVGYALSLTVMHAHVTTLDVWCNVFGGT